MTFTTIFIRASVREGFTVGIARKVGGREAILFLIIRSNFF